MKVYRIIIIVVSVFIVLSGCSNKKEWETALKQWEQAVKDRDKTIAELQQQLQDAQQQFSECQKQLSSKEQQLNLFIESEKQSQTQPKTSQSLSIQEQRTLIERVATLKNMKKGITIKQWYQQVVGIGYGNFGWYALPCPSKICQSQNGVLVSFRVKTDVGSTIPIWLVTGQNIFTANGTASGATEQLQSADIDITAAIDLIERQPKSEILALP